MLVCCYGLFFYRICIYPGQTQWLTLLVSLTTASAFTDARLVLFTVATDALISRDHYRPAAAPARPQLMHVT